MVECRLASARKASNPRDSSPPSWSRWSRRTVGRAIGLPSSSVGVPTVALNSAMIFLTASGASDLFRMKAMNTYLVCWSMAMTAYWNFPHNEGGKGPLRSMCRSPGSATEA